MNMQLSTPYIKGLLAVQQPKFASTIDNILSLWI